jgi:hypothetical protein
MDMLVIYFVQVKQLVKSTSAATLVRLASLAVGGTNGSSKIDDSMQYSEQATSESDISPTCDLLLQYQR